MKSNKWLTAFVLSAVPVVATASAYNVQELPVSSVSINQFASSIDNSGLVLTTLTNPFNPPIDMTLFSVDNFPSLSDPDAAALGEFNISDYTRVINAYRTNALNFSNFGQKLASRVIYQSDGTNAEYVFGFDEQTAETDGFTFSINATVGGSALGEYIVGTSSGRFITQVVSDSDGEEFTVALADFISRGFVQYNGQTTPLMPIDSTIGGFSDANAINDNLQVAGVSSIDVLESITTSIETCNSAELTAPREVCLYELKVRSQSQFVNRATIWQLDAQGQVLSTQNYGLSFTPEEDDTRNYTNDAVAINNAGIAVGNGSILFNNRVVNAAMVYENGVTRRLIDDDSLLPNFATNINDDGIVTGYQLRAINNQGRAKLFTYNLNTDELIFIDGFFNSSSTFARDINSDGIIVGDADIEAALQNRRRTGFVYNPENGEFLDLNDMIDCNSPYTIVSANSINDSGTIVADATVLRTARDARGDVILDANGNAVQETNAVALKLTPSGAETSTCPIDEEEPNEVRQGASNSLFLLYIFTVIAIFRRFKS